MRRLSRLFFLSPLLAIVVARNAGATSVVDLDWTAPPECPNGATARAAIERWLGEHREPSGVTARVVITRAGPSEWVVEVILGGTASGDRRLSATRCDLAARAASLIVAIAIDPQAASAVSDALEPAPRTEPAPQPAPLRPLIMRHAPSEPWHVRLGVFAAGERGYSPEFAPGAWVALGMERGAIDAELRGGGYVTTTARSLDGGVELWQLAVELRGCLRGDARLAPSLCLAMRGTRVQARGLGPVEGYDRSVLALAGVGGVGVEAALTRRVRVDLAADMLLLITRPRFVLDSRQLIYRPPAIGFAPWLGLVYRW